MRAIFLVVVCAIGLPGYSLSMSADGSSAAGRAQPNILLLIAEDMSSRVHSFGDPVASTPNIDALANEGVRFPNTFTTSGVCAPSRAALITGMHQVSIGAQHMRTQSTHWPLQYTAVPPEYVKAFPELLRAAGYYTFTDFKLDYQFSGPFAGSGPFSIWDAEGHDTHWRNRGADQPFFGMINFLITHESMIFDSDALPAELSSLKKRVLGDGKVISAVSATDVEVPPYLPDTPVVREDLSRHYNNIATMDQQVGKILKQLDADGLLESTIVIWTSDHGDGLPRSKREVYDSGIKVPMVIRWPDALRPAGFRPGQKDMRLISFVDLAPTILEFAGVVAPDFLHGRAIGTEQRQYVFASRDRVDSVPDRQRAVRDERFKYIRTYFADRPGVMDLEFRNGQNTMKELWRLYGSGKLDDMQQLWFEPRGPEALYDTATDPFELHNLASDPEFESHLKRLRGALAAWQEGIVDYGDLDEGEMVAAFWPDGKQPVTKDPAISVSDGIMSIRAENNASIEYCVDEGDWQIYSRPLAVSTDTTVRARAVRYGWRPSAVTEFVN